MIDILADNIPPQYSIDTSSLIRWWVKDYSPDVFTSLPDRLTTLIEDECLRAVRYIRDIEIKDNDDENTLAKWCKEQTDFYVDETEEQQLKVKKLMAKFQNPKKTASISGADPFVIAQAVLGGSNWYVVSEENPSTGNPQKNPNIPFVCNEIGLKHIRFFDMLRMENWQLR